MRVQQSKLTMPRKTQIPWLGAIRALVVTAAAVRKGVAAVRSAVIAIGAVTPTTCMSAASHPAAAAMKEAATCMSAARRMMLLVQVRQGVTPRYTGKAQWMVCDTDHTTANVVS